MIGIGAEAQLLLCAVLFYVYDASVLLYANEGLLSPARGGRWRIVYQPNSVALRGRLLYLPHLLLPHRPVFRLYWSGIAVALEDKTDWLALGMKYRAPAPFAYAAAATILLLLPVSLFVHRSDVLVAAVAILIYVNSLAAGIAVIRTRQRFGMERRKAWSTAAECLLCPPFAINLVRRVSLNERTGSSLPAAGRRLLEGDEWRRLRDKLLAEQDEDIEEASSEAARSALLRARALLAEEKPGHDRH